jgi:serine/threonine-protein kinase
MATVYKAYDPRFERLVAIKLLPAEFLHDPTFRARFEREAKTIAALEHIAIVPVYDFGEEAGQPYLVMRYMPGGSLEDRLKKGPLTLSAVSELYNRLAPALDVAHRQGIIHRDLKPGNILYDQHGSPCISDFGIAKLSQASATLTAGMVVGTPAYMSPEQGEGASDLNGRSDVYALGAILFQLLTGRLPYQSDTPHGMIIQHITKPIPDLRPLRPDLPPQVQAVLERAMAKPRDQRYATAGELAQAVAALLSTPAVHPAPASTLLAGAPLTPGSTLPPGSALSPGSTLPASTLPAPSPSPAPRPAFPTRLPRWLWAGLAALLVLGLCGGGALLLVLLRPGILGVSALRPSASPTSYLAATNPALPAPSHTPLLPTAAVTQEVIPSNTAILAVSPTATRTARPSPTHTLTPLPPTPTATFAPLPANAALGDTWLSPQDGMTLVYVPAGEFIMGSKDGYTEARPEHRVTLDAFWLDRSEVTNAQYALCVAAGVCGLPYYQPVQKNTDYHSPTHAYHPVIFVNWNDASAYCAWAGRRLPTEAEWEKGARGTDGRVYPWGNTPLECTLANSLDCLGGTAPVGGYPEGASPYGALDMSGNVWEWVADWYSHNYYATSPAANPPGPAAGSERALRGGAWVTGWDTSRTFDRTHYSPDYRATFVGFRCALSP